MQKLWIQIKKIIIFFVLCVSVTWISTEVVFAFFQNYINEPKDDILGAACISFIITYAFIKPLTHRLKIKSWLKFVLYFICYVFLLLLISLA